MTTAIRLSAVLVAVALALPALGAEKSGAPPLLDREIFFGDPEVAFASLSPDARYIAFAKPLDGVLNVWVKGLREPFSAARPMSESSGASVSCSARDASSDVSGTVSGLSTLGAGTRRCRKIS